MRRTVLGLCVVAGLGVTGYLLAGQGGGDKKACGSAALASKEGGGGCCGGCAATAAVAENSNYKRANEMLKSWQEAPVKLAAMSETEKADLQASFKKLHESHPAVVAFEPTMVFLHSGLATLTQIDAAAKQICAEASAVTTRPAAAEGATGETVALASAEEPTCPKAAAALASARSKMKQSVALTAKANELMLVAYQAACAGNKGECSKSGETVALASAEEKPAKAAGGCCGDKSGEAKLASAAGKPEGAKAEGSCCGSAKTTSAKLASAADKPEGAKAEGSCCGSAKTTAALAAGEGKPCVKTLVKNSQEIVTQSGQILAQWQGAGIRLASMESADRESLEKLASTVMASCPVGSRMPDTLETVAGLLRDAATLNAQAMAECCRNPAVAKAIPAGGKELAEARFQVIAAMINVLEKGNGTMKPARQVASAQ